MWRVFGMEEMAERADGERAFESGQYLIDRRRCANELRLSLWYAEHSDFVFKHVYGDKECFQLAWRKLGTEYVMPTAGPGWDVHTIVQFDHRGDIVFQHRCQDKWKFDGNRFNDSLRNEQLCFDFIADLKSKWDGVMWNNPFPTPAEQRTIDALLGGRFTYRRIGYDQRAIVFDRAGLIGEGAAECERRWTINHEDGADILTISRFDRPTCHLTKDGDGVWRGRWLEHERMPVELVPAASTTGGQSR